jgi:hypothetical protein
MRPRLFATVAVLAQLWAGTASAQQEARAKTVDEIVSMYRRGNADTKAVVSAAINGFIQGVLASSAYTELSGQPSVCAANAVIGPEFVIENMERQARRLPPLKTEPWQMVAFVAIREAFPCKGGPMLHDRGKP